MQIRSLVHRSNGRLGDRRGGAVSRAEDESGWGVGGKREATGGMRGQSKALITSHYDSLTNTKEGWSPNN